MARGQILTIPNQTATLVSTLSREQKASLSMLNPNDGICYVKLNGPASNTIAMWDWKVPSQSYCQLPGPWESLGVYYLDQSGSGRSAEVNVYELDSSIAVPSFIAIGRAVQQAGSTVDVSQGTQPANPPSSTVRLWADGTGHLHVLQSNGTDYTEVDSNNINTYAQAVTLAGRISGTIGANIWSKPIVFDDLVQFAGPPTTVPATGTGIEIFSTGGNNYLQSWQRSPTSGQYPLVIVASSTQITNNLAVTGQGSFTNGLLAGSGAAIAAQGDIGTSRNSAPTTGVVYFGNTTVHYLYWDGSGFQLTNALTTVGGIATSGGNVTITSGGSFVVNADPVTALIMPQGCSIYEASGNLHLMIATGAHNVYVYNTSVGAVHVFDASGNQTSNGVVQGSGGVLVAGNGATSGPCLWLETSRQVKLFYNSAYGTVDCPYANGFTSPYVQAISGFVATNGRSNTTLEAGYVQSNWASAMGSAWGVRSVRSLKKSVESLSDEECFGYLQDPILTPYRYEHLDESIDTKKHIGFMAEEMHEVLPEYTMYDEKGDVIGVDYAQITAMLWGAVRHLANRAVLK